MKKYGGLAACFFILILCVLKNIFIGYGLIVCWVLFALISLLKGYGFDEILRMSYDGGKKSFVVMKILVLIGAIISTWMASGTISTIVYYGLKYINPSLFLLSAFLICCAVSFLIGTSSGTVSTVGIPLMILARSGQVNISMAAGAIIAGAFFGDRCSPMSSSAALVSGITKTNIYTNVKNMLYSAMIPFLTAIAFYWALSITQPMRGLNNNLTGEILQAFNIGPVMLIPAVIMLVLSLLKVKVDLSMPISIAAASIIAIVFQKYGLKDILSYIALGFKMKDPGPLQSIIKGGGVAAMLKTCIILFVSCSLAGIFDGTGMFDGLKNMLSNKKFSKQELYGTTALVAAGAAAFGCTQATAVVMTDGIMRDCYGEDKYKLALDIENSAIVVSAIIPWNVAALLCTTSLNVGIAGYIPYAFFIYVLPFVFYIHLMLSGSEKSKTALQ
jgi:Na+/H+ antiporter